MERPYDHEVDELVDSFDDHQAARLLAAIYPTRFEQFLEWVTGWLWRTGNYEGRLAAVGDRVSNARRRLQWRRAKHGRHLAGKGRWWL